MVIPQTSSAMAASRYVQRAHKGRHESASRAVVHLERRAHLFRDPAIHHHHAVRHGQRLFLVMRHEDRGDPQLPLDFADLVPQGNPHLRIQRRQRLIQQQHPRAGRQRPRQRHPLLLPARQLERIPPPHLGQPDQRSISATRASR
jgi:hypothetical protein